MLSKFKSKLFSARGVFGGGDNEEKATPTSNSERDEVGVAKSDESQATDSPSDKDDALKWYDNHYCVHFRLKSCYIQFG